MIHTVIAKPTKQCNADCSFCSAPPDVNGAGKWTMDDFKFYFDRLSPHLSRGAYIIWHGGEPMLLGPKWYEQARQYADKQGREDIKFSIQTNLLAYKREVWEDTFKYIMGGRVSTSYEPDESDRTLRGSPSRYNQIFMAKLNEALDDGLRPMVIGTYTEFTAPLAMKVYDKSLSMGDGRSFDVRVNYRYPAGRARSMGRIIEPETYGNTLLEMYERWMTEAPDFRITPLDQMLEKSIGVRSEQQCPWTNSCGGGFLGLEPNGDVYNCADFADLDDEQYRFGNLRETDLPTCLKTKAAKDIRRRRVDLPQDCLSCPHFSECRGGCARDAVLYGKDLNGKFEYCLSWKMIFGRIKESIMSGEADKLLVRLGYEPEWCKTMVKDRQPQGVLTWV